MDRLALLITLAAGVAPAFAEEPILVEGARRATAYWQSKFTRCEGPRGAAWYSKSTEGSGRAWIQMAPELTIHFSTQEISRVERLNGVEFKATSSLSPGLFRWWMADKKAWLDWQDGEIAPPVNLMRKNGVWTVVAAPGRVDSGAALANCSEVPGQ